MRPIDADALREIVEDGLRDNPHKDGFARRCHRAEYTHFLDVICRMPTIAPPPNDPLTLEELRKMDEEWVWIKLLAPLYGMKSGYFLKRFRFSDENKFACGYPDVVVRLLSYVGYMDTWRAYRRRPEEAP